MKKGQQQTLIALANLGLGIIIALPFIYHAAYGITYTNAAIVAQDLATTINTMHSVPVPTQVQYQPDTSDYLITLSRRAVTVKDPSGTYKQGIYTPESASVQPSTAEFQSVIQLVSSQDKVAFDDSENRLSSFCEAVNARTNSLKIHINGAAQLSEVSETIRENLQSRPAVTVTQDPSDATIIMNLRVGEGDDFIANYKPQGESRLTTETACRLTTNVQSETTTFNTYDMVYDDTIEPRTTTVKVGDNTDVDQSVLGSAIAIGITGVTDDG